MINYMNFTVCLIVIALFLNSCGKETATDLNIEYLPIYDCKEISRKDKVKLISVIDSVIPLKKDNTIQKKAEQLAQVVSQKYFSNLKIKVSLSNTSAQELCLKINLVENKGFEPTVIPSWYQYFQGSSGGAWTANILISNFLQKHFKGSWVDKIRFYYQGEEFGEWDHIWLGEHVRYNFDDKIHKQ